ncbi:MAG: hypothetical protein JW866_04900 [Ignavibacteriales bacterium]|nr:hypothetical protein [Ignavibacteriales bacterium]
MKDILRIGVIIILGLVHFTYLMVSFFIVFTVIFEYKDFFNIILSLFDLFQTNISGKYINTGYTELMLIPFYLFLILLIITTLILLFNLIVKTAKMTAAFNMNELEKFLFIDRKRTIKFITMLAIPLIYFAFLKIFSPIQLKNELLFVMIQNTICHFGVFVFVIFIKSLKDKLHDENTKRKWHHPLIEFYVKFSFLLLSLILIVLPYILNLNLMQNFTNILLFNAFLAISFYINYKFYTENFFELIEEF